MEVYRSLILLNIHFKQFLIKGQFDLSNDLKSIVNFKHITTFFVLKLRKVAKKIQENPNGLAANLHGMQGFSRPTHWILIIHLVL